MRWLITLLMGGCLFVGTGASWADEKPKKKGFFGVQVAKTADDRGVMVMLVFPDGPADKAGLKTGDRILQVNGIKPANLEVAVKAIRGQEPGKKVKVRIERDGKEKELTVTVGEM